MIQVCESPQSFEPSASPQRGVNGASGARRAERARKVEAQGGESIRCGRLDNPHYVRTAVAHDISLMAGALPDYINAGLSDDRPIESICFELGSSVHSPNSNRSSVRNAIQPGGLETILKGATSSCRSPACPQPRKDLFASTDTSLVAGRHL